MLPSALDHVQEIAGTSERNLMIFLDFDGTLTPIVDRPDQAVLSDSTRAVLRTLAARVPVAVLSGRELEDVRKRVAVDGIIYAGSHGFDIAGPDNIQRQAGTEFFGSLNRAETELRHTLADITGALVERKRFSIAAHYRKVNENDFPKLKAAVCEVIKRHQQLRNMDGKKVYELLPHLDWNKGKAASWILENLAPNQKKVRPIYIGDDRTDEDAFRAVKGEGAGILVTEEPRTTAAQYSLKDPSEVERFLTVLISILSCSPER
jgi:trehalose-phosphatase